MTRRDRTVLVVLATVAIVAGFWFAVLKPQQAELGALDARAAKAEQRRDVALADLASAAQARVAYRRDSATLALLGKAVPADDDTPSLLYQLHRAARRAGVSFESVDVGGGAAGAPAAAPAAGAGAAGAPAPETTPGTSPGPEGLSLLPVKVVFRGSFFELDRFLRTVHRFARVRGERVDVSGRLLTIDGVALTPASDGLPELKAEIVANAYVAPAGAATPAPASTGAAAAAPADGSAGASTPSPSSTGVQ